MRKIVCLGTIVLLGLFFAACDLNGSHIDANRLDAVPEDVEKRTPETDRHPPILHVAFFETPVPLEGPINTAGLEDSPFITEDGNTLYFFFTPDARIDPSKQLLDGVTGIWVSQKVEGNWQEATRLWLQYPKKLALDGCPTLFGNTLWFCSAREGYTGVQLFYAVLGPSMWKNVVEVEESFVEEFDLQWNNYEMGEMHRYGDSIYFHSARSGGKGGFDIWVMHLVEDVWSDPINLDIINTAENESLPFISWDGMELWFTRTYLGTPGLYRSLWVNGAWQEPELIISRFAGEPTLDGDGNLYFVHHYFEDDQMIEADIYIAYRIKN